jgi:hypothetical protein
MASWLSALLRQQPANDKTPLVQAGSAVRHRLSDSMALTQQLREARTVRNAVKTPIWQNDPSPWYFP